MLNVLHPSDKTIARIAADMSRHLPGFMLSPGEIRLRADWPLVHFHHQPHLVPSATSLAELTDRAFARPIGPLLMASPECTHVSTARRPPRHHSLTALFLDSQPKPKRRFKLRKLKGKGLRRG